MEVASGFVNSISPACCNNKLKVAFCINASYSSVACFPPRTRIFPTNLRYKVVMSETRSFRLNPRCEVALNAEIHSKQSSLSASERLKTSAADPQSLDTLLKKVRDEFKMSESDCGSARVQVAQLTTKIKHVSSLLQKKDKQSRRGLQAMVQRRKKLLKYLRRTDWDSYCLVISKLGLRDNPVVKA